MAEQTNTSAEANLSQWKRSVFLSGVFLSAVAFFLLSTTYVDRAVCSFDLPSSCDAYWNKDVEAANSMFAGKPATVQEGTYPDSMYEVQDCNLDGRNSLPRTLPGAATAGFGRATKDCRVAGCSSRQCLRKKWECNGQAKGEYVGYECADPQVVSTMPLAALISFIFLLSAAVVCFLFTMGVFGWLGRVLAKPLGGLRQRFFPQQQQKQQKEAERDSFQQGSRGGKGRGGTGLDEESLQQTVEEAPLHRERIQTQNSPQMHQKHAQYPPQMEKEAAAADLTMDGHHRQNNRPSVPSPSRGPAAPIYVQQQQQQKQPSGVEGAVRGASDASFAEWQKDYQQWHESRSPDGQRAIHNQGGFELHDSGNTVASQSAVPPFARPSPDPATGGPDSVGGMGTPSRLSPSGELLGPFASLNHHPAAGNAPTRPVGVASVSSGQTPSPSAPKVPQVQQQQSGSHFGDPSLEVEGALEALEAQAGGGSAGAFK
uniref:Transmembrane protein n=1 Tax=Chromera velia CCMP2878 TaxID=1169474 RepID=A0A0G4F2G2_9ALVE|eukprot:Cvel_14764.t1-p1 / transcript=Cvel_14764.t1 / gene=Cvel_14764 / organism=Chromera_velia_CCMP2878 / gene_product=hypothetical protein / transcript_product=hypothetical protein / location=Cvel_scaffold1063:3833-5284(-) / protein_length=484 / sequence_SO=supercontig / SO=protein_coding / is_pseudo=false